MEAGRFGDFFGVCQWRYASRIGGTLACKCPSHGWRRACAEQGKLIEELDSDDQCSVDEDGVPVKLVRARRFEEGIQEHAEWEEERDEV